MSSAAYQAILKHRLQQRSNYQGWRVLALLTVLILIPAVAAMVWGPPMMARIGGGGLLLTVATIYWGGLVINLVQQNRPNSARLVPGHLARLRHVLLAGWLLSSLLATLCAALMSLPLLPAWLVATWGMATLGMMMRWPLGWALLGVLPFMGNWLVRHGLWAQAVELMQNRPALCALISLVLPPLALLKVLGEGDASHRKSYARAERWREMAQQGKMPQAWESDTQSAPWSWFNAITHGPYRYQLRKLSASRDPSTLVARLFLGLGPATHWTAQVSGALVFVAILGLVCLISLWIPISFVDFLRGAGFGLTIGLMSSMMGPLTGLGAALFRTRNEQRLLVLLPGVPRGRAMNRVLARQWQGQYMLTWLLGLLVGGAALALEASPLELLLPLLLAYLLPAVMVWRDWARLPGQGQQGAAPLIFSVVASALLGYALYRWAGVPIWLYGAAQLAVVLGLGLWRWRRQLSAPQALPVGRLA